MRIIQIVKPTRIEASTKSELLSKLTSNFGVNWVIADKSNGYRTWDSFGGRFPALWIGVNMEKRRRKSQQGNKLIAGKDGHLTRDRKVIRPAQWVAWIYVLPSNVNVQQGSRTFKLTAAKRDELFQFKK